MQLNRSIDDTAIENAWLTIGIFDGVHRGHQQVLQRLIEGAHAEDCPAVVLTFTPHPAVIFAGKSDFKSLNTPRERADILASLGVDVLIDQAFDRALANLTAFDFMQWVHRRLGLRHLIMGYDTSLGRNREADAARLAEIGTELGYTAETVPPLRDDQGIISSTRIRAAVSAGNVAEAAANLGRYFFVSGPVVHGDGRGHTINIPTANIRIPPGKLIPANGIYACQAWVEGQRHQAAVNVGVRPTFTPDLPAPAVEAYILDFNRSIYGVEVKVEFVQYLRPEEKYPNVKELLDQIHLDIEKTREVLSEI
jgi:riboflavin kinase/FMN adenylyltransferase